MSGSGGGQGWFRTAGDTEAQHSGPNYRSRVGPLGIGFAAFAAGMAIWVVSGVVPPQPWREVSGPLFWLTVVASTAWVGWCLGAYVVFEDGARADVEALSEDAAGIEETSLGR